MYTAGRDPIHNRHLHASQGRQAVVSASHSVHFYEDDALFLDSVSEFVGAALGAGGACVLVATDAHRAGLDLRLQEHGIDLGFARSRNRLITLDAAQTLARVMVNGYPREDRFNATVEPELVRARQALGPQSTSVVAFGEMVTVLWQDRQYEPAIELERLWENVAQRHSLSLRCAYPIGLFTNHPHYDSFRRVCAAHHQVIPAESYTSLDNENDRHRMISSLQQKAWTMQAVMKGRAEQNARLKQAETDLHRSEEFARGVIECSPDCIMVLDMEGRVQYTSQPCLRALEIETASEFLGSFWVDLWDQDQRPRAEAALAGAFGGAMGSFAGESVTAGGQRKSWDVKITPALDVQGRVERLIAISRDVTELRIAQKAAFESERQAGAGRLAATIAHEINNPLEAVTNSIFLAMGADGLPDEARRYLQMADRELARAGQITRQMLGFYRGTSKPRWVSVSELIHDVVTMYNRKLRNKQLTASISVDPRLSVYGKDGELRQMLLNLTANAVDASHPGGKLWFRAHRSAHGRGEDDGVRITLADNGSGMPPEVQRRIFVPFFTTKGGTGTGIGLWVTKCLVEQQGGRVQFRSSQGTKRGTVMSLFFPTARLSAPAIADVA